MTIDHSTTITYKMLDPSDPIRMQLATLFSIVYREPSRFRSVFHQLPAITTKKYLREANADIFCMSLHGVEYLQDGADHIQFARFRGDKRSSAWIKKRFDICIYPTLFLSDFAIRDRVALQDHLAQILEAVQAPIPLDGIVVANLVRNGLQYYSRVASDNHHAWWLTTQLWLSSGKTVFDPSFITAITRYNSIVPAPIGEQPGDLRGAGHFLDYLDALQLQIPAIELPEM